MLSALYFPSAHPKSTNSTPGMRAPIRKNGAAVQAPADHGKAYPPEASAMSPAAPPEAQELTAGSAASECMPEPSSGSAGAASSAPTSTLGRHRVAPHCVALAKTCSQRLGTSAPTAVQAGIHTTCLQKRARGTAGVMTKLASCKLRYRPPSCIAKDSLQNACRRIKCTPETLEKERSRWNGKGLCRARQGKRATTRSLVLGMERTRKRSYEIMEPSKRSMHAQRGEV